LESRDYKDHDSSPAQAESKISYQQMNQEWKPWNRERSQKPWSEVIWNSSRTKYQNYCCLLSLLFFMYLFLLSSLFGGFLWSSNPHNKKHQVPVAKPVILATQEAEIKRIMVWSQPRKTEKPSQK
jgi:hypothetical protein